MEEMSLQLRDTLIFSFWEHLSPSSKHLSFLPYYYYAILFWHATVTEAVGAMPPLIDFGGGGGGGAPPAPPAPPPMGEMGKEMQKKTLEG